MIEFIEDTVNQTCSCKSDKLVTSITIQKSNDGFVFFEIKTGRGPLPNVLSGKYSTMRTAQEAVRHYLENKRESQAVKNEYVALSVEDWKKTYASKHI